MTLFTTGDDPLFSRRRGSYANPHATIAIKDIPTNIKQVMRLTRFYYVQDALLGAIIDKMSEYPVTQVIIDEVDELNDRARDKWDYLINVAMNLRQKMIDINVDKYIFGQSFHYLYYPFIRYCICNSCGQYTPITAIKDARVRPVDRNKRFSLEAQGSCPKCGYNSRQFKIEDRRSESRQGLDFVRMNPLRMSLEYNPSTGARDWYWEPPDVLKDGLNNNVRAIIDTTEMRVLEAVYKGYRIRMNKDRLWVSQAPGLPGLWQGWGIPPVFRVLEDVYYYKILRRANEALAQEHVTPFRILSPAGTGDVSPQRTVNLTDWQNRVRGELSKFRRDPNHIMVSPIPLNIEQMGGQARVMMVAAEMEAAARVIAAGIGCPIEMIWGGLNWSGASVSLRVLENHFINDRENCERLLSFLGPKLSSYFRLPRVDLSLSDFKMADDVQKEGNAINLMLQGFLSRQAVLTEMGYDSNEEFKHLEEEHEKLNQITMQDNVFAAHMNTIIQELEAKAQILLQYELQITQQMIQAQAERKRLADLQSHVNALHQQGYATPMEFDQTSMILQRLPDEQRTFMLQQWSQTMPFVTSLLLEKMGLDQQAQGIQQQALSSMQGMQQAGAAEGAGMDPGAAGPYAEGPEAAWGEDAGGMGAEGEAPGMGDADLVEAGAPLPEQRPPQRQQSPI